MILKELFLNCLNDIHGNNDLLLRRGNNMVKNVFLKNCLMNTVFPILSIINQVIPKDEKTVLLYGNLGFRDNIRYLYDYLIENNYNKKYKIVISSNVDPQIIQEDNVKTIGNLKGVLAFLTAGHVYYSFGKIPIYPSSRQCVIQTWHGTPFKGIDATLKRTKRKRSFYSYALVSSDFFRKIGQELFSCKEDNIAICGQPRTDVMYNQKEKYPILSKYDKFVLWMPTFRQSKLLGYSDSSFGGSMVPFFNLNDLRELNNMLEEHNVGLVIKLHPAQDLDKYEGIMLSHVYLLSHDEFIKMDMDLYKLMGQADALITDYSSVFFDFMLMDKPIAFTLDDFEEYKKNRGFVVDNPDFFMAGHKIRSKENMIAFMEDIILGKDKYKIQRQEVNQIVNRYQDGENRKRALILSCITK